MASSASPAIPPFNKVYLISTWVETVLWGFNTLVFSVVCYLIFWKRRSGQNRWILFRTSALLYLCATLNVVASLRQELEAFIYAPPDALLNHASVYYADQSSSLAVIKTATYTVAILIQDIVLTWRMYIVWGRNWKVIALPAILEVMRFAVALSSVIILAQPGTSPDSTVLKTLSTINWPVELVINISVTAAIASRLWSTGSRVSSLKVMSQPSTANTYIRHIFLLVESGALLVGTTISLIVLYNIHTPAALAILDVATQIVPLVAYLVIVRAAFGLTHGLPGSKPDKAMNSYGVAASANGVVFQMDQLESGARIRSQDVIHVTREVVTDAEQSYSVDDYKADRVSV